MFLVTLGERLGLPVFISPLLLAAGAMVAVNPMQFWLVLFATAVPCLLGDAMWYELGRWKGRSVIAAMCRISFVPDSLEEKAYAGLDRFRGVTLLWAKWIPGVAHLAPPLAGAAHLPRSRFHLYNSIGSLLWILIMLLAGVLSLRAFDWMAIFTRSAKVLARPRRDGPLWYAMARRAPLARLGARAAHCGLTAATVSRKRLARPLANVTNERSNR